MVTHELVKDLLYESFPRNKKITIIDYGCGNGLLLNFLNIYTIHKYIGYDINAESIQSAKKRYAKLLKASFKLIAKDNVPNLGKRNLADAVVLIGVLQYMSEEEKSSFLKKVSLALKKDGILIITCTANHKIYKLLNIYRFFIPHKFIDRMELKSQLKKNGLEIIFEKEKGLIIAPLFSNFIVFFFDALDKIIFRTKGELGLIGTKIRLLADYIIKLEYKLPIDYGYTLVVKAKNLN